jgi:hypothetical protein
VLLSVGFGVSGGFGDSAFDESLALEEESEPLAGALEPADSPVDSLLLFERA